MPKHISKECSDLLTKIMETDPDKRYTAEDIKKHPWYKISEPVCIN
jgi:SNF-related kinase